MAKSLTENEFNTIPDYVSAENRQRILELAVPNEKEVSDVDCNEYLIRHWLELVEDGNPLYYDKEYAQSQGYSDVVAQPGMVICTLTMPYRWPMKKFFHTRQLLHFEVKELIEQPVGILANYEMRFFKHVEIGDRLSTTGHLENISEFKRTRLGEGYFTKLVTSYYNQKDELVAEASTNLFSYGGDEPKDLRKPLTEEDIQKQKDADSKRAKPSIIEDQAPQDQPEDASWLKGGWHNATEEMLEAWRTGWEPQIPKDLYYEDVSEGDKLPELMMPITVTRCNFMASASRDFAPQHHNSWYAQNKSRSREMFLGTHYNMGMMSRFLTDFGGPKSFVTRIQLQMMRTVGAGEDYIMNGVVTKKWQENGENLIDIDVTIDTQHGPAYRCSGTLTLPSH